MMGWIILGAIGAVVAFGLIAAAIRSAAGWLAGDDGDLDAQENAEALTDKT